MSREDFESRMQTLRTRVKAQPRAEGFQEILLPGEPEARTEGERRAQGIPLTADVLTALRAEGQLAGRPFPDGR